MKVVWNAPNVLTLLRVLAAPLLAYFLMRAYYEYALYTFVFAAITDALDGFIARHFDLYTEFGAALDPLADKLITLTCLVILTFQGWVPLWLTLAIVVRDTVIVAGAFSYHHLFGEVDIHPTWLGKLHTFAAFALFIVVLTHAARLIDASGWLTASFLAVLVTTLVSMAQYVVLWGRKAALEAERRAKASH
ncbi:MAG: CDP-alcohol phosphatidyltransferase family protein [Pseudomonadota bacterium]